MRVIKTVGDILGFDLDFLLRHSFKRKIYAIPLAKNYKRFLKDDNRMIVYEDYLLKDMVNYWKERWLERRKETLHSQGRLHETLEFTRDNFYVF